MSGVTIGVDVGGTTVAAGLVTADGLVLEHAEAPTHARGAGRALDVEGKMPRSGWPATVERYVF